MTTFWFYFLMVLGSALWSYLGMKAAVNPKTPYLIQPFIALLSCVGFSIWMFMIVAVCGGI